VRELEPGCQAPGEPDRLSRVSEPQPTRQVTIRSASWLSGPTVWYSLAHAIGQNLWPSLGEHALVEPNLQAAARGRALDKEAESWLQVRRYASVNSASD
jgi:hypothetical protein